MMKQHPTTPSQGEAKDAAPYRALERFVEQTPRTDLPSWEDLYERLRLLAVRRSTEMILDEFSTDDQFDRGARCLRTLMGAAEIARRIKTFEDKERSEHDERPNAPQVDEAELAKLYRKVVERVEHFEQEQKAEIERADAYYCPPDEDAECERQTGDDQ